MVTTLTIENELMASDLKIRAYREDPIPSVLSLLQTTLGNSGAVRKTEAFWQWKHHANPFGASYGLYAWDEAEQRAAGLRVLMRWVFRDKAGKELSAVRAVDTATHPAYQRQGLFSRLTRQAITELSAAGIACIFNTPNQKSLPGYLKMGWQVAAQWPLYIKPLRPLRMAWRRLRPQAASRAWPFAAYFGAKILTWPAFIAAYGNQLPDFLVANEATRRQVGLRTSRTLAYLTWRYGQHPTVQYGVYAEATKDNQLVGFAILRPNVRYGWQEVVLTELCLVAPERGSGGRLLQNITRQLRGDYLIAHFAEQTLERQLLRRNGFLRLPRQQMTFAVRPLQPGLEWLSQSAQWDLTLGDLEIF
ncbi:MAG: GNAT family N-acetyltransferase [Caldilinea sp. CFX5]|nr:GNAT family N-acetyltransferase [Caldilinea sp. CFX5]